MIFCGLSAVAYIRAGDSLRFAILLTWVLVYIALILGVRYVERQGKSGMRNIQGVITRTQKSGDGLRLEP